MTTPAPRFPMRVALLVVVGGVLAGCSIQPWVKPYERERLADPIMQLSRNGLADKASGYVPHKEVYENKKRRLAAIKAYERGLAK